MVHVRFRELVAWSIQNLEILHGSLGFREHAALSMQDLENLVSDQMYFGN